MARKLKVYRTPIGFHDAYVAATSQKAALEAWGTDTNLFARGVAEEVTDPTLAVDALAAPGSVIRKMRGTDEENFAALPPETPKSKKPASPRAHTAEAPTPRKPKPPPKPRPSRATLDAAEAAIETEDVRYEAERVDLAAQLEAIQAKVSAAQREHDRAGEKLERERADAEASHGAAMKEWRASS